MLTGIASPPVLVANRAHKKSRLGCSQCKLRKIKVRLVHDFPRAPAHTSGVYEKRPLCTNCARHYKDIEKCDFSSSASIGASTGPQIMTRPRPNKKQAISFRRGVNVFLPIDPGSDFEPFDCLPDCKVPKTQRFLHHCKSCSASDLLVLG